MAGQKTGEKWKTKKWVMIVAPKEFNSVELGETVAQKESHLIGRIIKVNLDLLSKDRKFRNRTLKFQIKSVEGTKAMTELIGLELKRSYVERLARKRKSRIQTVTIVETKDNKKVKVNVLAITARKAPVSKEKIIRKMMVETIQKESKKHDYTEFMKTIAYRELSNKTYDSIKKIYPIQQNEVIKAECLK